MTPKGGEEWQDEYMYNPLMDKMDKKQRARKGFLLSCFPGSLVS
jgi:hypothetical protein